MAILVEGLLVSIFRCSWVNGNGQGGTHVTGITGPLWLLLAIPPHGIVELDTDGVKLLRRGALVGDSRMELFGRLCGNDFGKTMEPPAGIPVPIPGITNCVAEISTGPNPLLFVVREIPPEPDMPPKPPSAGKPAASTQTKRTLPVE